MSQALRAVWGEMRSLEAVASVVTAWREAPSCMALPASLSCREAAAAGRGRHCCLGSGHSPCTMDPSRMGPSWDKDGVVSALQRPLRQQKASGCKRKEEGI